MMQKMYCPLCKSEINVSINREQIKCPVCDWCVPAKTENIECPNCKTENVILIPKDTQAWEVGFISVSCPNRCDEVEKSIRKSQFGELYYLKCDERARVNHPRAITIKCRKCKCILGVSTIEGIYSRKIIQINPLVRLCIKFSEKFAKKMVVDWHIGGCHSILTHFRLKRIGEIIYCLILFLILWVPKILVFYITSYGEYFRWGYDTYFALSLVISFYIGYQIIQQMTVILGEFETTATDFFRIVSTEAFIFLKGSWLIIISIIIYLLCWLDQTFILLFYGLTEDVKIMILDDITFQFTILVAFVVQVIFTLGVFVFSLWYDSRLGISSLKGEFFKISSIINKLCGLCIYVVLYLIALYSINSLAVNLSAHYEPLTKIYFKIGYKTAPILGTFWEYLHIGCIIILPAVTYFGFLGNLARNLESEELKKINYKSSKVKTLEEKNYLLSYASEVRKTLRAISIIDYVARLALVTYLGLFVRELIKLTTNIKL